MGPELRICVTGQRDFPIVYVQAYTNDLHTHIHILFLPLQGHQKYPLVQTALSYKREQLLPPEPEQIEMGFT